MSTLSSRFPHESLTLNHTLNLNLLRLLLVLALSPAPTLLAAEKPAVKPIRALLICGGCCHDYNVQKDLIAKGLSERAHIEFTAIQQGGKATNSKIPFYENVDWAKDYDIVLHDECF